MITHLLDTSVYCQPLKRRPVVSAIDRWDRLGDERCATSRVCVAEVEAGLQAENLPVRLAKYTQLLQPRLDILPVDEPVWRKFSELKARQHREGVSIADMDLLIGAAAMRYDLILATLNARHFSKISRLRWEDWNLA